MNDIAEIESTFEHVDSENLFLIIYFSPLEIELTLKSRSGGRDGIIGKQSGQDGNQTF